MEDTWIGPHLVGIRDALIDAIEDWQLPPVAEAQVLPGDQVAVDFIDEDSGGLAWVRLTNAFPSTVFPEPDTGVQRAIGGIAFGIEVGIMRWIEVPDIGAALDSGSQLEATRQQLSDMRAMFQVLCQYPDAHGLRIVIGNYTPAGPQGLAVGGLWAATLEVLA